MARAVEVIDEWIALSNMSKRRCLIKKSTPVTPQLFVGNRDAAKDCELLKRDSVTHIVNVGGGANHFESEFCYCKFPRIEDTDTAKLLPLLVPACVFIDNALGREPSKGAQQLLLASEATTAPRHATKKMKKKTKKNVEANKVLIHCRGGRSRSCSVAVAWLMWAGIDPTVDAALKRIQQYRPQACPNPNFLKQLQHFQRLLNEIN